MRAGRALLLATLWAVASASAFGQLVIAPASLPVGGGVLVVGQQIPLQQLSTNGNPQDSFQWSVSAGSLPPGLTLDPMNGSIIGTPVLAGAFTFTVTALDLELQVTGSRQYTLYVSTGSPLSLFPLTHPGAAAGTAYIRDTFRVSGGVPGYSWALKAGTNSDGLTLDPVSGFISGIPSAGGIFPIGVVVTDASGAQAVSIFNLNVLGISSGPLPNGALGIPYSQSLVAVGATGPFNWLSTGALPPGLNMSPQGQITGTPTAGGTFPFQISVTDIVTQLSSTKSLTITVPLPLTVTTASLPNGTIGAVYPTQTLTATGGVGALGWSLVSGTLPPGITLGLQGQLAGTPTQSGAFPFQVRVADSTTNLTATQSLSIAITAALTITTTSLPNGTLGSSYSQTLQGAGGTVPYTWSASGLPAGLTLNPSSGVLSGIPTAAGTSTISLVLTDAAQGAARAQLASTINALGITPATLQTGFVGVPYSATTLAVAGATVANWAVTAGSLPAGLVLNSSTGVISGTPTAAGSSTFTVTASFGVSTVAIPPVVQQFTMVINASPTVTISGLPATGVATTQPTATVALSGGTYPLNITGTLTLTFASAVGGDDQMVQFSNGTRSAPFVIVAGSSQGLFGGSANAPNIAVLTGTVAGTITIATNLKDSTGNTLTPPAPVVITVNPTVPFIKAARIGTVANGAFSISVTGYSTPRDMISALFHFTSPTGTQLASADVTVPLTSSFTTWYSNPASNAFGSQFTVTVQFAFTGPPGTTVPFTTVAVTLTNSKGVSNAFGPVSP